MFLFLVIKGKPFLARTKDEITLKNCATEKVQK